VRCPDHYDLEPLVLHPGCDALSMSAELGLREDRESRLAGPEGVEDLLE